MRPGAALLRRMRWWRGILTCSPRLNASKSLAKFSAKSAARVHRQQVDGLAPDAKSLATDRASACSWTTPRSTASLHRRPTIEPYSVRRTSAGHLLMFGMNVDTGESRSYRLDRVNTAKITRQAFRPRYVVELTASDPLAAPAVERLAPAAAAFAPAWPTMHKCGASAPCQPQAVRPNRPQLHLRLHGLRQHFQARHIRRHAQPHKTSRVCHAPVASAP